MAQRVGIGIALLFHDRGTRGGEWSAARPGRTLPREGPGTRFTNYRRALICLWQVKYKVENWVLIIPGVHNVAEKLFKR